MKKVIEYLKNVIKREDKIVVSCSGGPDSMCLLSLIVSLKEEYNLEVICAHVNHKVRDESDEEENFVRTYCEKHQLKFELLTITEYKDNFHNDARVQRYKFLEEVIKKYNINILMTAHHGDDLVETVLMRIARGSNIPGYAGFKVVNNLLTYRVIRPLIYVTKKEIIDYNNENGVEYRIDESNKSDLYTRNRYRHKVLPILKEESESIHLKYLKFSEELYGYDNFVKNYIVANNIIIDNKIDLSIYNKEDKFIQKKSIEALISIVQQDNEFYVTDNIINEIVKLINSDKGRATIDLPNGFKGYKENKCFYIEKI